MRANDFGREKLRSEKLRSIAVFKKKKGRSNQKILKMKTSHNLTFGQCLLLQVPDVQETTPFHTTEPTQLEANSGIKVQKN